MPTECKNQAPTLDGKQGLLRPALFALIFWGLLAATWSLAKLTCPGALNKHQRTRLTDLGQLGMYQESDAGLTKNPNRVVFLGDSITYLWDIGDSFKNADYVNRGIEAQTSADMLVRFRQDVINLQPKTVVVLAGINDMYEGRFTGKLSADDILTRLEANYQTMAELAELHGIRPVFVSVLPIHVYTARAQRMNLTALVGMVASANNWLRQFCTQHNYQYIDTYSVMVDQRGMMRKDLSEDGVHPNRVGYQVMTGIYAQTLRSSPY